jgi:hypothetical protein
MAATGMELRGAAGFGGGGGGGLASAGLGGAETAIQAHKHT